MKIARLLLPLIAIAALRAAPLQPLPYVVPAAVPEALEPLDPSAVHVDGWLGARLDANVSHRLLALDTAPLLAGYRHRPGEHPWIGEHIGKWLHAATLAWAYTGDEALKRKIDEAVAALIATQEPDGYLGTYLPGQRLGLYQGADWDVWSHKYNLIGLLTYYRYTGNAPALAAARRVGDLLVATFPAQKSILAAGTHHGMAATSTLEPMVELYRLTGDARYLAFARYLVQAYEEPGGPDLVRALLAPDASVAHIANGKAYEMLSNLVGIGKLYQVTGDEKLLRALQVAWTDITTKRLYLTGAASMRELFSGDHELPNEPGAHPGETCVTTTWIQFNALLLAQTGDARYAAEIERSLYNHLAAAQNPRGDDWCYYTALDGVKKYDAGITCCHSSGPRGFALAPGLSYLQAGDTLTVNTLETSRARFTVGGQAVELRQESGFPNDGRSVLTVATAAPVRFALRIRVPEWAAPLHAGDASGGTGWLTLPAREWHDGDRVPLSFTLTGRVVPGTYTNQAKIAYSWGPFVLALDLHDNPAFRSYDAPQFIRVVDARTPTLVRDGPGLRFQAAARGEWDIDPRTITLVPFADAGAAGSAYAVWLRGP